MRELDFYFNNNPTALCSSWEALCRAAQGVRSNPTSDHYSDGLLDRITEERAIHHAYVRIPFRNQQILSKYYHHRKLDDNAHLFGEYSEVVMFMIGKLPDKITKEVISKLKNKARQAVRESINYFQEELSK